ncbi:MAG: ABC transporter permease, partial [Chloroflexota bacterium]
GELTLYTDNGPKTYPIVGIYNDYSNSQGTAAFWLDNYRQDWDDDKVTGASLKIAPGEDPDEIVTALQAALTPIQRVQVQSNQSLRDLSLEIFERTFAITGALQLLATVVAFVGVLSAMLALQLEKQRQLGILRAVGMTVQQLWGLVLMETGLMGAVAGLLSMPTGYILSLILVYIINRRSFGWTLQMLIVPDPFLQALLVAVGAAVLAGIYPAYRIGKRITAEAIRFD